MQDAGLKLTQYAYDAVGRQVLVTDPDGRRTGTVYDERGMAACAWRAWNSASPPTSCSWNPASYTDGEQPLRYAAYSYTANGAQQSIADADNNTTQMVYDGFDRLRFTLYPELDSGAPCTVSTPVTAGTVPTCSSRQTYEQYGYDNNDNRTTLRTRKGDVITSTYNPANQVDTKSVPSLSLVNYRYWLSGDAMGVTQGSHSTSYDYDDAGRVHSETNDGRQVVYGYDRAGNRQSTLWPDSYLVTYVYNALNKIQDVYEGTTSGSLLAHYDYDILTRRQFLTYANNSSNKIGYGYEANDRLNALSHQMASVGLTFGYGRNGSGQITGLSINDDFYLPRPTAVSNTGYGVNRLNQYTAVGAIAGTESNGQPKIQGARGRFLTIPFDDLSIVIPSVGIGRTPVDSASDPGGSTVVYDLNGNMRRWVGSDGARNAYTYDAENRLRTATTSTHNVSYDYDARGRRISKTVDGVQTGYLLDGDEEIAEYNVSGGAWPSTPARRYVTGLVVDDRIAVVDATSGNAKNYYHVNHQGSVLATTDSSGNVVQRLSYDEYGNLGSGSTTTGQVFRYTGRRFDAETGLYYYRARYYAPQIGRFLQADPIGYRDDLDLYAYVYNDPLDKTDPSGLGAWDDFIWGMESGAGGTLHRAGMDLDATGNKVTPGPNVNPNSRWATVGSAIGAVAAGMSRQQTSGLTPVPRKVTVAPVTQRYSRALYKVNSQSPAAVAARTSGEGVACPTCGQTQVSGTPTAPQAEHSPPLSQFHYEGGGAQMTPAQKKAYANSPEAYNGSQCGQCQKSQGGQQAQYTKQKNEELGL